MSHTKEALSRAEDQGLDLDHEPEPAPSSRALQLADERRTEMALIAAPVVSMARIKEAHEAVRQLMSELMQDGLHYGKIPGAGDRKVLLKPGAELLGSRFALTPEFSRQETRDGDHLEVVSFCSLRSRVSGEPIVQGVSGSCSTRESKYGYRWLFESEVKEASLDPETLPKRERKSRRTGKPYVQYRVENEDLPDLWNTVRKMADKRAYVAAILIATGCSDIFTQDFEDTAPAAPAPVDADWEPAGPASKPKPAQDTNPGDALVRKSGELAAQAGLLTPDGDIRLDAPLAQALKQAEGDYRPQAFTAKQLQSLCALLHKRIAEERGAS